MGRIIKRSLFKSFLGALMYVLFGLLVFVLTTLLLHKKSEAKGEVSFYTINDDAGYVLEYPDRLRISDEGLLLLYVETKPCAKCSESLILNMVQTIKEAGLSVEPMMVYHLEEDSDTGVINDYYDRFADYIDLVVSCDDSIRIRNPWIPRGLGFYGIVTDSMDRVKFAGSMLDSGFLACCSREFGNSETGWE